MGSSDSLTALQKEINPQSHISMSEHTRVRADVCRLGFGVWCMHTVLVRLGAVEIVHVECSDEGTCDFYSCRGESPLPSAPYFDTIVGRYMCA